MLQAEAKKKARLERFGVSSAQTAKPAEDSSILASKLAARAERFALSKSSANPSAAGPASQKQAVKASSPVQDKDAAAQAKAAALVKPAANPEAEAKRQVRLSLPNRQWAIHRKRIPQVHVKCNLNSALVCK